jgi:hypothetical protein
MKYTILTEFQCSSEWLYAAEYPIHARVELLESLIGQGYTRTMGVEFKIAGVLRCPRYTGTKMACNGIEMREWMRQALMQDISLQFQGTCPRSGKIGKLYCLYCTSTTVKQFSQICTAFDPTIVESMYLRYLADDYLSGYVIFPKNTM